MLFQIERPDAAFAYVHLTWSAEINAEFPYTVLYRKFEEFVAKEKPESEQCADANRP
jgi:hypothetical protein